MLFWYHIHEITAKNLKKTQEKFFVDTKTWVLMICFKMHFGRWWRTGKHGVLQSMGSPRVGHGKTHRGSDPKYCFTFPWLWFTSHLSSLRLCYATLGLFHICITQEWAKVCRFVRIIRDPFLFWDFSLLMLLILGLLLLVPLTRKIGFLLVLQCLTTLHFQRSSVLSAKSIKKQ